MQHEPETCVFVNLFVGNGQTLARWSFPPFFGRGGRALPVAMSITGPRENDTTTLPPPLKISGPRLHRLSTGPNLDIGKIDQA